MRFRRKSTTVDVAVGAVFGRTRAGNLTEVATVTWVGADLVGIPHVRFLVSVSGDRARVDSRILALAVFSEQ